MSDLATIDATSADGPRRYAIRSGPERRREYSDAEKAAMVAERLSPDVCIADIARRRGIHPQQLHTWRRQAKRGELALTAATPMFAEVVTAPEPAAVPPMSAPDTGAAHGAAEVVIALGDLRLRIGPGVPPERAAAPVAALHAAT